VPGSDEPEHGCPVGKATTSGTSTSAVAARTPASISASGLSGDVIPSTRATSAVAAATSVMAVVASVDRMVLRNEGRSRRRSRSAEARTPGGANVAMSPGSPYAHPEGVLAAITAARTGGIPLLGTCGGFQHLLLEFARSVCGLTTVEHGVVHADATELLVVPLACKLFGEAATVIVAPGTVAARAMGPGPSTERYFCRFGLNSDYERALGAQGLVISGRDGDGDARIVELPDHPFFVGTLFQPGLSSDTTWVHPLIGSFAAAVRAHASRPTAVVS
jgi:CTP synthase (UTP-ammonia lyase)